MMAITIIQDSDFSEMDFKIVGVKNQKKIGLKTNLNPVDFFPTPISGKTAFPSGSVNILATSGRMGVLYLDFQVITTTNYNGVVAMLAENSLTFNHDVAVQTHDGKRIAIKQNSREVIASGNLTAKARYCVCLSGVMSVF